jgi:YHS domain-containing protein
VAKGGTHVDAGRNAKKAGLAVVVAGGVALFAVSVFGVPLASILVLGVALMCPLLMVGMHGGGHDHGHGTGGLDKAGEDAAAGRGGTASLTARRPHVAEDGGLTRAGALPAMEVAMEIDPICGMVVDPDESEYATEYRRRRYVFCSRACLDAFRLTPAAYL